MDPLMSLTCVVLYQLLALHGCRSERNTALLWQLRAHNLCTTVTIALVNR